MNTGTTYKTQKPIQADIIDNRPFYMVVKLGSNGYQKEDASPTVRYDDESEAREEAERLAVKHPNHPRGFAVVKAIAIVRAEVFTEGVRYGMEYCKILCDKIADEIEAVQKKPII